MEYLVLLALIVLFVLFVFVKGALDEAKAGKKFIKHLYEDYGNFPYRQYKPEEYRSITKYHEHYKTDNEIDDITWNDLSLDAVFQQMNHTYSSAGEEYLYHRLRTPLTEEGPLLKQENLIRYFQEHEDHRVKLQLLFAKAGRTGKFSIFDYLYYLDELKSTSNTAHYVMNAAIAAAAGLLFFSPGAGVFLLITLICMNVALYFKAKGEIEPYITSLGYIMRLLNTAGEIVRLKISVLEEENTKLRESREKFKKFKKGSFWLMSPRGGGDPLSLLMDYLRMILHLDIIQFYKMLKEIRNHTEDIQQILTVTGYLESVIAIGAYRASLPEYCLPEFGQGFCLEDGYHPLLEQPVKNSIRAHRGVLITGSNASGKSTFLKTAALNAILAQTIHTCFAGKYCGEFFRIYSSMALRDSLDSGESYYIVEIKSLKRILTVSGREGQGRVLCFVDEVLRGTNTVERIAASAQILKSFSRENALCFAATHDIELTYLLEGEYDNYHFEEEVKDGDVLFSYLLQDGRARSRNAIKLLSILGYDDKIIKDAEELAEQFLQTGSWQQEKESE